MYVCNIECNAVTIEDIEHIVKEMAKSDLGHRMRQGTEASSEHEEDADVERNDLERDANARMNASLLSAAEMAGEKYPEDKDDFELNLDELKDSFAAQLAEEAAKARRLEEEEAYHARDESLQQPKE